MLADFFNYTSILKNMIMVLHLSKANRGNGILDETPKAQTIKEIIDKLDIIKIKNFCSAKGNVTRRRRQQQTGRKHS